MNSLMNYGSDDDSNDSGDEKFPAMLGRHNVSGSKNYRKPAAHEDNYEEVGMDMSEDSDDSSGPPPKNREESRFKPDAKTDRSNNHSFDKRSSFQSSSAAHNSFSLQNERRSSSPKSKKEDENRRSSKPDDRVRDEKYRRRDERGSRDSRDEDTRNRDRSVREDDKGRERDRDRYRDDRRDNRRFSRDRRDRDRRRSRSRERRRSRSPRRSSRSPRRSSRSPRRASRSPRRSRSGSREKKYLSRREKADKRMDRLDKLGIQFKPDNYPASAIQEAESKSSSSNGGNRFFMPGITGRFREQIEKRKQLWQKAKEPDTAGSSTSQVLTPAGGSKATKVYEATTFSDDKTSNKFKRLMGIKGTETGSLPVKSTDVLKKQQEMFSSMEAQYEVARTATHTMRGVGLGFGSFQR